ncbi:MAG: hypothetical protein WED10_10340, partial [Brumimicrobium sp.]
MSPLQGFCVSGLQYLFDNPNHSQLTTSRENKNGGSASNSSPTFRANPSFLLTKKAVTNNRFH